MLQGQQNMVAGGKSRANSHRVVLVVAPVRASPRHVYGQHHRCRLIRLPEAAGAKQKNALETQNTSNIIIRDPSQSAVTDPRN
jgi:hypothetical protein